MSGGNQKIGDGRASLDHEMRAFDMLGPLSRRAIADARFQIGAASLVRGLVDAGMSVREFADAPVDRAGARCVRDLDCKIAFRLAQQDGWV